MTDSDARIKALSLEYARALDEHGVLSDAARAAYVLMSAEASRLEEERRADLRTRSDAELERRTAEAEGQAAELERQRSEAAVAAAVAFEQRAAAQREAARRQHNIDFATAERLGPTTTKAGPNGVLPSKKARLVAA